MKMFRNISSYLYLKNDDFDKLKYVKLLSDDNRLF